MTCASRSGRKATVPSWRLEVADLQRQAGAAIQQGQQLAIDGVDAPAQCQQFGFARRRHDRHRGDGADHFDFGVAGAREALAPEAGCAGGAPRRTRRRPSSACDLRVDDRTRLDDQLLNEGVLHFRPERLVLLVHRVLEPGDQRLELVLGELLLEDRADRRRRDLERPLAHERHRFLDVLLDLGLDLLAERLALVRRGPGAAAPARPPASSAPPASRPPRDTCSMPGCCSTSSLATSSFFVSACAWRRHAAPREQRRDDNRFIKGSPPASALRRDCRSCGSGWLRRWRRSRRCAAGRSACCHCRARST